MGTEGAIRGTADVVIVGAGPSGAVVALTLAGAGLDVLCLERGEWPAETPGAGADWELDGRGPGHFSPNRRRGPGDDPIDDADSDLDVLVGNGVGGGTVHWGAQWERFLPSDFRVRTLDGVGDDWPLGYDDLAPYYARLDREFGLAAAPGDPAFPREGDPAHPPLPLLQLGERVAAAHNRLGWHWWPGPNAVGLPAAYERAVGGGYPAGLRARAGDTHWPSAVAAGARLVTGARAQRVLLNAAGEASGVAWVDADGTARRTDAPIVVLAAGGIGTPRLLLHSASAAHPDGLGNGSGLVGRRLMLHPFTRVVGLFDEPFDGVQGYWGQLVHSLEFAETDRDRGFVRGAKWNLGQGFGAVTAALHPTPGVPSFGPAVAERVRGWVGRAGIWGITAEDLPEEGNRIELDPGRLDPAGVPIPVVHYRTPEDAARILAFSAARAAESLREAGAREVIVNTALRPFAWHQLGTARMGVDPAASVVDPDGRMHEVPGLLVVDGSVFVTGSSLNPTLTSTAFALRAAERLLARLGLAAGPAGPDPAAPPVVVAAPAVRSAAASQARPADLPEAVLAAAAALLVPAAAGLPGADGLTVGELAPVLARVPALADDTARALAALAAGPVGPTAVAALERDDPAGFAALREVVVLAWARRPALQAALGAPARTPIPMIPTAGLDALLAPLAARGPRWRDPAAVPEKESA